MAQKFCGGCKEQLENCFCGTDRLEYEPSVPATADSGYDASISAHQQEDYES